MREYSRQGIYVPREKKLRTRIEKKRGIDWINVFLFVLVVVLTVLMLFSD